MDSDLKTITLPDTVTYIEGCAFYGCKNLARITIPNSLISIGSSAFENCTGLNGVYLSDINTWFKIDFSQSFSNPIYYAHVLYLNDEILTELDIPDGTTNISKNAFIGCSSLTSVKVPKSVTNIGSEAFYMCTNLTSVTVLDSVNSIGKWAFYGCDNLTIYGYDNSFAQSYAADNSIPFIIVSDDESLTGDTNLDGKISISDVTAIQRHLAESEQFTNRQLALADTNGDGIIDINDATHLQKFLAEFEGVVLGMVAF